MAAALPITARVQVALQSGDSNLGTFDVGTVAFDGGIYGDLSVEDLAKPTGARVDPHKVVHQVRDALTQYLEKQDRTAG